MTKRIGFACKWIDTIEQINGIKPTDNCKQYNTGTTTIAWLKRQSAQVAEQKLWDLIKQNIEATRKLVEKVGTLDEQLRMVRISSDLLPAYTHPDYVHFYRDATVKNYLQTAFSVVGETARSRNVRLSFHPGQFCVLASENDNIVERSIEEFEYHADMARYMGYGKQFQDFKINVHISGRKGPQGIKDVYGRLSPEARNFLTIENEENSHSLAACMELIDTVPIVLDVHHHWVREGEYISPSDDRVKRVIDSWRGVRPTMHYSVSREDYLVGHSKDAEPDMTTLLANGYKKQKMRAHSDSYWNNEVNAWVVGFLDTHDIMCESKAKNLASFELARFAKEKGLI